MNISVLWCVTPCSYAEHERRFGRNCCFVFSVQRYREHKTAFRNNNQTYSFAKHLNEEGHSFDPMSEIMQVLHRHKKGRNLTLLRDSTSTQNP